MNPADAMAWPFFVALALILTVLVVAVVVLDGSDRRYRDQLRRDAERVERARRRP